MPGLSVLEPRFNIVSYHGGPDTHLVVRCVNRLLGLLQEASLLGCTPTLHVMCLVIWADGALTSYGIRGYKKVRVKPSTEVYADIGVPADVWRVGGTDDLRVFLAREVYAAFEAICERLEKRRCPVDKRGLLVAARDALETFLADDLEYEVGVGERKVHAALRSFLEHRRLALALGEGAPGKGLPTGWDIREDPGDDHRVIIEPSVGGDG